jgi:hypothetical protein
MLVSSHTRTFATSPRKVCLKWQIVAEDVFASGRPAAVEALSFPASDHGEQGKIGQPRPTQGRTSGA